MDLESCETHDLQRSKAVVRACRQAPRACSPLRGEEKAGQPCKQVARDGKLMGDAAVDAAEVAPGSEAPELDELEDDEPLGRLEMAGNWT